MKDVVVRTLAAACIALGAGVALNACGGDSTTTVINSTAGGETTTSTTTETATTSAASSGVRQQFDELLRDNLTGQQGLSDAVADCVVDELQNTLSDDEVQQVIDSGQLTSDATKAATAAGIHCAQAGG
jgi:hypothetical protein